MVPCTCQRPAVPLLLPLAALLLPLATPQRRRTVRRLCCPAKASSSTGKQHQLGLGGPGLQMGGAPASSQLQAETRSSVLSHHVIWLPLSHNWWQARSCHPTSRPRRLKSHVLSHHMDGHATSPKPRHPSCLLHCTPTCRLKSHVFSHYVDGQLYREPRLHLRTLRRLAPRLAAMKKPGGKVSWAMLNQGKQAGGGGRAVEGSQADLQTVLWCELEGASLLLPVSTDVAHKHVVPLAKPPPFPSRPPCSGHPL